MNPRENLLSLYRQKGYEFAPVSFKPTPPLKEKMQQAIGAETNLGDYFNFPQGFAEKNVPGPKLLPREEEVDWRQYYPEELNAETNFSPYGVAREKGFEGTYHFHRMHHPMANFDSVQQMEEYPWPEFDFQNIDHMKETVQQIKQEERATVGPMASTIWETAWAIRDMTQLMMDMAMEDEKATYVLDKVTSEAVSRATAYGKAGVDILHLGDDIGMQETIMMSVDMYRDWLKPRLAEVIKAARAEKPDVLVFYHSCGYVEPFIPDLIEAGVDILNPVQPECMDFAKLHSEYGDVLSFNGTLGTQTTMPFGTPEDVRSVVNRNLDIVGDKGGLVVTPTHALEPEVPWENVEAYVCACRDYEGS